MPMLRNFVFNLPLVFQLMLQDGIDAFYTTEGLVAVKTEALGAAYIAQIVLWTLVQTRVMMKFSVYFWMFTTRLTQQMRETSHVESALFVMQTY